MENCHFNHIILYNCQNISIDNCSFKTLGIFKCSEIYIKASDITNLDLDHCCNSHFKVCSIENATNLRSQGNIFELCQFPDNVKKKLQLGLFELPKNLKYWPILAIIMGLTIVTFTVFHIIDSTPFGLYWYLSIVAFIIIIVLFLYLSKIQEKQVPNKIISFEKKKL